MNRRDRRALVVGGWIVGTAALGLRVIPWAVQHALAAHRELAQRAGLLARARSEVTFTPALRDSAAVLTRAMVELAPRLVGGPTAAEALADLAGRVNLAASRSRMRLERVSPLPDTGTAGRLARVRSSVALEGDVRGLAAFLAAVELGDAPLTVDEIRVVASDATAQGRGPEVLRIEVTLGGWYLRAAAGQERGATP